MKRFWLSMALGVAVLTAFPAKALYVSSYGNIGASSWAQGELQRAYEIGWLNPVYPLGENYTFQISREQFAHLIVDLIAFAENTSIPTLADKFGIDILFGEAEEQIETYENMSVLNGSFLDTQDLHIELAARMGIAKGFEGAFAPTESITRSEAAQMIYRCMQRFGIADANQKPIVFQDHNDFPDWAEEGIKFVSGRTTSDGRPLMGGAEGKFAPLEFCTIEEMILSLGRMYDSLSVTTVYADWRNVPEYESVKVALTFGGDCTFGRNRASGDANSFDEMYAKRGAAYFFSGIPHFFDDDLSMVNFEGTLTNATKYANKEFVFKGPAQYADILRHGSIDVVTIANNHSYDYLEKGFQDTIKNLTGYVQISGYDTYMPIVKVKGVGVGFASNVGWTFDAKQKRFIEKAVSSLRARGADIVVFNYHWGKEGTYQHNATQAAIAHYCIDQGADLVIGHHPHVVQEVETYKGKQIAYSLGNLVFGGNRNPKDKKCMIFRQNFTVNLKERTIEDASYQAIPYQISSMTSRNDYHPIPLV